MKAFLLALIFACSHPGPAGSEPHPQEPTATHPPTAFNVPVRPQRRMLPPEAFLRAYMMWFGGLAPLDIQKRGGNLFDQWQDYLAAMGLPDYAHDFPRVSQSNTMMLATLDRLAEVLCTRAAEHDLRAAPPISDPIVFAFETHPRPSYSEFAEGFDMLHRTFVGYPADLAPKGRLARFYALYQQVASEHASSGALSPDETAWVAVCTALVIHPEAELY